MNIIEKFHDERVKQPSAHLGLYVRKKTVDRAPFLPKMTYICSYLSL